MQQDNKPVTTPAMTIFICVTCRGPKDADDRPGQALYDSVTAKLRQSDDPAITVTPVECLAVCKRPCTLALAGAGKWTCVVGDLDPETHAGDVIEAARSYIASDTGIIPWRQRPVAFRKGVVARIPPLGFGNQSPPP